MGFHFKRTGAFHHARYLAKSIYNLVLCLLSPQLDSNLFSANDTSHVIVFAEFVGVLYTFWFLKAPFACTAPEMDLQAIRDMENYKINRPDIVQACINIMK